MDLSNFTPAELDDLAASLFEELVKRQAKVKVLARLSNDALKNLAFSILDVFAGRYRESSAEEKHGWEQAYRHVVGQLFPELLEAHEQKSQLIWLGGQLLERFGPMIQQPRKVGRNEMIDKYRKELSMGLSEIYDLFKTENPELLTKGKGKKAKLITLNSMKREYNKWLQRGGNANPPTGSS